MRASADCADTGAASQAAPAVAARRKLLRVEGVEWGMLNSNYRADEGRRRTEAAAKAGAGTAVIMAGMKLLIVLFIAAGSLLTGAETKLGKPLAAKEPVAIGALLAKPADYVGKTVQVKGRIVEVCQEMGCWMYLADAQGNKIRIKVNDGEIVFPKDGAGRAGTAEGVFTKQELTREQAVERAREEAKDTGKKFDPASIKSGTVIYQIQGTGAVLE